jgi:hypothetical protein
MKSVFLFGSHVLKNESVINTGNCRCLLAVPPRPCVLVGTFSFRSFLLSRKSKQLSMNTLHSLEVTTCACKQMVCCFRGSCFSKILYLLKCVPPIIFFPHGVTAPSGPGSLHYPGFTITLRHTTLCRDSSGRVISPTQRLLSDNTQHS